MEKERISAKIPRGLYEQLRRAAYHTPGASVTEIVEQALQEKLDTMEAAYGGPFPERKSALKTGRRVPSV